MADRPGDEVASRRETYTLGYDPTAVALMAHRTATTHADFLLPHLSPGMSLLDCGCGPGAITIGFAELLAPGQVVGIEIEPDQVALARRAARERGATNVTFEAGDAYELPVADESFDRVHIGAVLINLRDPQRALREAFRVLKPGGAIGVREGDQGGDLLAPEDPVIRFGLDLYTRLRQHNGHDPFLGRRLRGLLQDAGFERPTMSATYESFGTPEKIRALAELWSGMITRSNIAKQLVELNWADEDGLAFMASAVEQFAQQREAFHAVAWCQAVAWKPL